VRRRAWVSPSCTRSDLVLARSPEFLKSVYACARAEDARAVEAGKLGSLPHPYAMAPFKVSN